MNLKSTMTLSDDLNSQQPVKKTDPGSRLQRLEEKVCHLFL